MRRAIWRLRRCVVGLQTEDFPGFLEVLGFHFPWIHRLRRERGAARPRGRSLLSALPQFAVRLIANYNRKDMLVYRAARIQFRRQLARLRASGGASAPPLAPESEEEAKAIVDEALSHTATYQNHKRLSEYLMR